MINTAAGIIYYLGRKTCDFQYLPKFPAFYMIISFAVSVIMTITIVHHRRKYETIKAEYETEQISVKFNPLR